MNTSGFSLTARLKSFKYAFQGIYQLVVSQHNAWIHSLATIGVILAGVYYGVDRLEWCVLILAIAMVWSAEAINTAIEALCDKVEPDIDPMIKQSKDIAAAAVLICALAAAVIGVMVFGPYIFA